MPNIPPKAGPGGLHEIKHDGYRLIIARQGPRVRLLAGAAMDWSGRYPLIVEATRNLGPAYFVIVMARRPRP